jgi:hypothetical protein
MLSLLFQWQCKKNLPKRMDWRKRVFVTDFCLFEQQGPYFFR